MLATLVQHCHPDLVSNAFSSLLSLFNNIQGAGESILEYQARFDSLTIKLSHCKVLLPLILSVMLFLGGLYSCYSNIVEQFWSCFKQIETASIDSIVLDVTFHDRFTLVDLKKGKLADSSGPKPSATATNTNRQGKIWQFPFK
jgi:hypothetical protein